MINRRRSRNRVIATIALFRLAKAALLACVGIAAFRLINPRLSLIARAWVDALPLATEHRFIGKVITRVLSASKNQKELAGFIALAYAALFATEGTGLWLEKRWAEYLTIGATASFIPFEVYEVVQRVSVIRIVVLLANAFIIGYLIHKVRSHGR